MKKVLLILISIIFLSSNYATAQWSQSNTGMYGGLTTCFAELNGYLFAGSMGNSVYRSPDNGSTWEVVRNGLPLNGVRSLIVIGSNLFAATWGGGIYVTTNNGVNWSPSNTGLTNLNVLSFFVKGSSFFAGTASGGLFVSTNNGANWQLSNSGLPNSSVSSFIAIGDSIYVGTGGSGVYLSTNNGASWIPENIGISSQNINALTLCDNNYIYAASHTSGVYISTNKGASWGAVNNGITNLSILNIKSIGNDVFAATNGGGICLTKNDGLSWSPKNIGLYNTYVLRLYIGVDKIFAGTDGGAFLSTNYGDSWSDITSGLTNACIIYLTKDKNGNLFAGTYGRGVFKSSNNGAGWFEINNGIPELYIYSLATKRDSVFAGSWSGDFCLSTNGGASWSKIYKAASTNKVWAFAVSGSNVFVGTSVNGVFLSTDGGGTWNTANSGITNLYISSFAVKGTNIFAGTGGGGVFLSTNNGGNWTPVNSGLTRLNVLSLALHGSDLWAGTNGGAFLSTNNGTTWQAKNTGMTTLIIRSFAFDGNNIFAATNNGAYLSTNNGTSWQTANNGLINMNTWALITNLGNIFIGTYGNGVFKANLSDFGGSPPTTITTGTVANSICPDSPILVPFTTDGTFNPGNIFTAQLSDATGNFSNPTNIGSLAGTTSGSISCIIPKTTPVGARYRIRVISSNPVITGSDNGSNITINLLPVPEISGANTACQFSTQIYSTIPVTGHSYQWKVTEGDITGADNLSSASVSWTSSEPSGTVALIETIDATGCKDSTSIVVLLNPVPTPGIEGHLSVCNNSTQIYSSLLFLGHSYKWSVTGGSIIGAANKNAVQILWNTSDTKGAVTIQETIDFSGCSATVTDSVVINQLPAPFIQGDDYACRNSIQDYKITKITGNSYKWKVEEGNIVGADNLDHVSILWNSSLDSGRVTVVETNGSSSCSDSAYQNVKIYPLPEPFIDGSGAVFQNSIETYTAALLPGNSYKWYVEGGNIIGEDNKDTVLIQWSEEDSGTLTLIQTIDSTGCVDSTSLDAVISPYVSPSIAGSAVSCVNSIERYSTADIYGNSYKWRASGGNIIGQDNKASVLVQWVSEGSVTITLVRTKTFTQFKDSVFNIIKINPLPPEPSISGIFETCRNNVESYTGSQTPGSSLLWSVSGGEIIGADDKSSVQVKWLSDASGTVTLTQTLDSSGCRSSSYQTVLINPLPNTIITGPITVLDNSPRTYSVEVSQGNIYKWSVESGAIVGPESSSSVEIIWDREHAGEGKLKVVINSADGCIDSSEINVLFVIISVPENAKQANYSVKLYPNPSDGIININIVIANSTYFVLEIYNAYGEKIKDVYSGIIGQGAIKLAWDATDIIGRNVASGIYFISIKSDYGSVVKSIILLK